MKIIVRDINKDFIDVLNRQANAWYLPLNNEFEYKFECGDIFSEPAQAIVSPANSFGFMDGGIDLVYSKRWPHMQEEVQYFIKNFSLYQEILVGDSELFVTRDENFPYLIVAPTMRVPMKIDAINVYLATRSAIVKSHSFDTVVFPGMGTGCGQVNYVSAANAMIKGFLDGLDSPPFPQSWQDAYYNHFRKY
jgi:O-acetyl-ADP-ribose deacetylase (regulator of RNase III)